jgi:hypothetical protein
LSLCLLPLVPQDLHFSFPEKTKKFTPLRSSFQMEELLPTLKLDCGRYKLSLLSRNE